MISISIGKKHQYATFLVRRRTSIDSHTHAEDWPHGKEPWVDGYHRVAATGRSTGLTSPVPMRYTSPYFRTCMLSLIALQTCDGDEPISDRSTFVFGIDKSGV
jgi:hypothetical protein